MKVTLKRMNNAVHFVAKNAEGNEVHYDGGPSIGGEGKGVGSMETVLMAAAACSSIDVVLILQKMRQPLEDYEVEVQSTRNEDQIPKTFKTIHLHYILSGKLKEKKVKQAVESSLEKYCSVTKMLEPTVEISSSFEIRPPNEI